MNNLTLEEIVQLEVSEYREVNLIGSRLTAYLCWLNRSDITQLEAEGRFPKRVYISEEQFGYPETEVDVWSTEKLRLRRKWFPDDIADPMDELDTVFAYASDPVAAAIEYAAEMDAKIEKLEAAEKSEKAAGIAAVFEMVKAEEKAGAYEEVASSALN